MKQVFYSSLDIKANEPIDKRLYIAELTIAELQNKFGQNGEYGHPNSYVFNESTRQFMSLQTYVTPSDVINPLNWATVAQYIVEFPQWQSGESYGLGSCAVFTDSYNATNFWIGLGPITPGQSPETNPELWYNLSAASELSVQTQRVLYRLDTRDPEGLATRQFTIAINADVSNNGVRTPNIDVWADLQEDVSGNPVWTKVSPRIVTWINAGVSNFEITFSGDLSDIYFDELTPSQNNILITIS